MKINENPKRYDKYEVDGLSHYELYSRSGKNGYKKMINDTLKVFQDIEKGTVIDVGCGDGLPSFLLAKMGFKIEGVDYNKFGLDIMNSKFFEYDFNLNTYLSNIEDFIPEKEYDYMLCIDTIEHLEDPSHIIRLMDCVKKFAVIVTDNDEHITKIGEYHARQFTKDEFSDLFNDFKIELIPMEQKYFFGYKIYANNK